MKECYRNRIELLQSTLDLLVLETLRWGPQHGYEISRVIQSQSGDEKKASPWRFRTRDTSRGAS